MRFAEKEEVELLWTKLYDEKLVAIGPRNGVVHKLLIKEFQNDITVDDNFDLEADLDNLELHL